MITEYMSLVFMAAVFGLFWYVWRGIKEDDNNPVWGNLFASALCCILCIFLAYCFLQGNIAESHVVANESYQLIYQQGLSGEEESSSNISLNSTDFQYILHANGAGMYTVSSLNPGHAYFVDENEVKEETGENLTSLTDIYYTYNVIYTQIQDMPCVYLFGFLACCSGGIFVYFLWIVFIKDLLGLGGAGEDESDIQEG
jgi:hypothetical protein